MSSWLNFNDSLNNLKGQITNFATNVLADEEESEVSKKDFEELKRICAAQEEELEKLRKANEELLQSKDVKRAEKQDQNESWEWEPEEAKNGENLDFAKLKKQVESLEEERDDLLQKLEQLDLDNQENIGKIYAMKDKLQQEYNSLEEQYEELKKKGGRGDSKEELEEAKKEIAVLKSTNDTLSKIVEELKASSAQESEAVEKKLKKLQDENKVLRGELMDSQKVLEEFENKVSEDAENCKKLAFILESYEKQVSELKTQLEDSKNELDKLKSSGSSDSGKFVEILSESINKFMDCEEPSDYEHSAVDSEDPGVQEFGNQVEDIMKMLLEFKCKCSRLSKEVYDLTEEKTNILNEKNHEIEKLIKNSEILSQEVITKSQAIKEYENECAELGKNNDLLIKELNSYKSSGLQTISESNEDNMLQLEQQLDAANNKINEMEAILKVSEEKLKDFQYMQSQLEVSAKRILDLETIVDDLEQERGKKSDSEELEEIKGALEKSRNDCDNLEYQLSELNVAMESLKEENETSKKKMEDLLEENKMLKVLNQDFEQDTNNLRDRFEEMTSKYQKEENSRRNAEAQVMLLTEKLQNCKMNETSLKLQFDTVTKELIQVGDARSALELLLKEKEAFLQQLQNESEDMKKSLVFLENIKLERDQQLANMELLVKDLQEKVDKYQELAIAKSEEMMQELSLEPEAIQKQNQMETEEISENKIKTNNDINEVEFEIPLEDNKLIELKQQLETLTLSNDALQKQLTDLTNSRNELVNIIQAKHHENITYHAEIQRLTALLSTEAEKTKTFDMVNGKIKDLEEELEKLRDQNGFLKEKCDVLTENLLQAENSSAVSEKEAALNKKLERLHQHLISLEEQHTEEMLQAEKKNAELQAKVNEIEQREKNSSTMYTSVSIRANQQVEVLQNQVQLLTNQREELRKKISDADDLNNKQAAALANLQFVLEQFQKDKEKDVQMETERIRRQILAEQQKQEELKKQIASLNQQLEESKQGLSAASRLSDQLENSKKLIAQLKDEVAQLQGKLSDTEKQLNTLNSQGDGKVDKSLVKNLIIGFVSSNNNLNKDQMQILKIIATVLDFNQQDHEKVQLNKAPQGSWLGSLLSPQGQGMSQESLSQAFIKFLENESKPRVVPSLLDKATDKTVEASSRKSSVSKGPIVLSEIVLPTFADFGQSRNSSSILKDVLKDNNN